MSLIDHDVTNVHQGSKSNIPTWCAATVTRCMVASRGVDGYIKVQGYIERPKMSGLKARDTRTLLRGIACDSATTLGLVCMPRLCSAIQGTGVTLCRSPINAITARSQHAALGDDGRLHVPLCVCTRRFVISLSRS